MARSIKRATAFFTQEDYDKLMAIADTEERHLGNLIGWWAERCAAVYCETDSGGQAYVYIRSILRNPSKAHAKTGPCKVLMFPEARQGDTA